MGVLHNLLFFIVAIGVLVTIHEFGHFWVARKLGVKVLCFSVGFGKPIWSRRSTTDGVVYQIAAIPLGGYVKMADERESEVEAGDLDRAFNRQSVWKRFAIVAAGPLANFLFAIVAYALMYMVGINGIKPVIGDVAEASPAYIAGMRGEQQILKVGNESVKSWQGAGMAMIQQALKDSRVDLLTTDSTGREQLYSIPMTDSREYLGDQQLLDILGIEPWRPILEPVIGRVEDGRVAQGAGLQAGDRIVAVDGQTVETWERWVELIAANPRSRLEVQLQRGSERLTIDLVPERVKRGDANIGYIGAGAQVEPGAYDHMRVVERSGPIRALGQGVVETGKLTGLTLRVLWKLVTGRASPKNISGPISIAEYAGLTAAIGLAAFLGFLAMISVSLGILNLLPIPVLDGGHLFYYLIEIIKGSPVSAATEAAGQRLGLLLLAGLMFLAFYNDLTRVFTG